MKLLRIAHCSELGSRSHNEDAVVSGTVGHTAFAALADGAGGHRRGAEAARRAVDSIARQMEDRTVPFSPANLSQMVRVAHWQLQAHQDSTEPEARMHSTLVVLWIDLEADQALWTHVGDSRLYRVRRGRIDVVTVDDSVVQRMTQAGLITAEQARRHPQKNQLLAALGTEGEIEPHTVARAVELAEGDAFLLCSDGWWDHFEGESPADSLARALTPQSWLADMRATIETLALPRQDNFSAIAVWAGDPGEVAHADDDDTVPRALS
jgi:serine/threonine protein phosphatase PrpC